MMKRETIFFRLSEAEKREIKKKAKEMRMSVSAYLRMVSIAGVEIPTLRKVKNG